MVYKILFYVSVAVLFGGTLTAAWQVLRQPVKPFVRNLLISIIVVEIIAAIGHIVVSTQPVPLFWEWFFYVKYKFGLSVLFSELQFMLVGITALLIGVLTPDFKRWQRLFWLFVGVAFAAMSLDEYFSIHQSLGSRTLGETWRLPYAMAGLLLFSVTAAAYWYGFRRERRTFALFGIALVILAITGVILERLIVYGFVERNADARWLFVFEEVGKLVGQTIVLSAFLLYLQNHANGRWPTARRALLGGAAVYLAFMLGVWLVVPGIEAQTAAQPLHVQYEGGLELVSYAVTPSVTAPGGEIAVTLYWRAHQLLPENYSLSVHVLSHPEVNTMTQSDDLNISLIPAGGWLPGVVNRRTVYLDLPEDLPAPASYWLMVRPWYGPWPLGRPWQDTTGVTIADPGSAQELASDAVIAAHLAVLPNEAPTAPPTPTQYDFPSEGFTLSGYSLPDSVIHDPVLPVRFWWRTRDAGKRTLSQFFHLVPAGGGETQAFDQEPFGGRFPTSDWSSGMDVMDSWQVTLPDSLPPGRYDVYTGLYDAGTMERLSVVDASGQPIQDNALHLGTIDYQP